MRRALFWDASALVKVYAQEDGTANVKSAFNLRDVRIVVTDFVALESIATIGKKRRSGIIDRSRYRTALTQFYWDYKQTFDVLDVERIVRTEAMRLAEKHHRAAIGALDLLHVASASYAATLCRPDPLVLIASDQPLLDVAQAEGLRVYNPEVAPHAVLRHALR
jgi:predicted nucleic acid-binding protein